LYLSHFLDNLIIIRKLIELFFILIEVKGLDWIVKSMKNSIKKIINILCKTGKLFKNTENIVHMYGKDQIEEYISLIFSKNYVLLGVNLVKKRLFCQH